MGAGLDSARSQTPQPAPASPFLEDFLSPPIADRQKLILGNELIEFVLLK